ncbi:hypothetical protein J7K27_08385 [Candidatus Bathyarchaeota archaeon]|nr:hypothetical protein [Candidatus Bathyarchaeota archaeon]
MLSVKMRNTKWVAGWLIFSLFCFTIAGAGLYLVNNQAAMFGVYPQPVYTVGAWNPFEILKWIGKLASQPEYSTPGEPTSPKAVAPPATVDDIDNIFELVAYCNAHPDLVNKRIQEAAEHYDYQIPKVTCQARVTTTGKSGTVQTTWFFKDGKFQKIEYGFKGTNVKAEVVSDESFAVTEVKLFLKGQFEQAENLAKEGYGTKYRVLSYNLDPPAATIIAAGLGLLIVFVGITLAFRRVGKWVFTSASIIYTVLGFIYTAPYGPPIFMAFAGVSSLITAFLEPKQEVRIPTKKFTVQKYLEQA